MALTIAAGEITTAAAEANIASVQLGEDGVYGNLVYLKGSDRRLWKAQANDDAKLNVYGILIGSGSAGGYVPVIKNGTKIRFNTLTLTQGAQYCLSGATGGGIDLRSALSSGHNIIYVFTAINAHEAVLDIKVTGVLVP